MNPGGAVVNRFSRGLGHLIHSDQHGFYLFNVRGDVVQRVDSYGDVIHTYRYDAFGNQLNGNGVNTNPFRFAGEYLDFETGFIYLRARFYNPLLGRFISEDPHWNIRNMQFGDSVAMRNGQPMPSPWAILQAGNLYAFVMNSPVMWVDPSGRAGIAAKLASSPAGQKASQIVNTAIAGALLSLGFQPVPPAPSRPMTPTTVVGPITAPSTAASGTQTYTSEAQNALDQIHQADARTRESGKSVPTPFEGEGCGGMTGDPGSHDPNNRGFGNMRVLQEVTIKGYRISMDLERGGSGLYNIHLKVNGTKYIYQGTKGFINAAGRELPRSLKNQPEIQRALNRALNAIERGW